MGSNYLLSIISLKSIISLMVNAKYLLPPQLTVSRELFEDVLVPLPKAVGLVVYSIMRMSSGYQVLLSPFRLADIYSRTTYTEVLKFLLDREFLVYSGKSRQRISDKWYMVNPNFVQAPFRDRERLKRKFDVLQHQLAVDLYADDVSGLEMGDAGEGDEPAGDDQK